MLILNEIVATDMSRNSYEGSFAKQNVYYNQVMQTRGTFEAGYLIEESELLFFLSYLTKSCVSRERVGGKEYNNDTNLVLTVSLNFFYTCLRW